MAGSNLIEISDSDFESEVLQSDVPVLVDFWAEWCAPCRMVAPILEELAVEYDGRLKIAKVNVDHSQEIAARYEIMSIPTVILFRDGQAVKHVVGALPKESLIKEFEL